MQATPVMVVVTIYNVSYEVLTITGDWSGVYITVNNKNLIYPLRLDFWELKLIAYLKGIR